jgi:hypothetical protein
MDSGDDHLQLLSTRVARKKISRNTKTLPIDAMIESGIVSRCVEFLSRFDKYVSLIFDFECFLLSNPEVGNTFLQEKLKGHFNCKELC